MSPPKPNSEEHYNKTGEDESKITTTDTKKIGVAIILFHQQLMMILTVAFV